MNRYTLAAFAILAIALIVLLTSEPPPPARKRVRVAGKPETVGNDKIIRDDFREQKRG